MGRVRYRIKTEYGVIRNVNYETGELEIQLDSGLWVEANLNPAEVQDMKSDDVVSVTLNSDMTVRYIYSEEV